MRRLCALAILAALALLPVGPATADVRIYLRFLDFPVAGQPVKWGARALVGNCNHGAGGRIEASAPITGKVKFGMNQSGGDNWSSNNGEITFAQPGEVTVWFRVNVMTCQNQLIKLVQEQTVHVAPAKGEE